MYSSTKARCPLSAIPTWTAGHIISTYPKKVTIAPGLAIGAGFHHERMDGKGYPNGLKGDEIPEIAQVIAVADTFDAMYSTRPYRKKLPLSTVAAEIERSAGTQLSPRVVEAFMELVREGAFDGEGQASGGEEDNQEQGESKTEKQTEEGAGKETVQAGQ